jgi:hypothetical protein
MSVFPSVSTRKDVADDTTFESSFSCNSSRCFPGTRLSVPVYRKTKCHGKSNKIDKIEIYYFGNHKRNTLIQAKSDSRKVLSHRVSHNEHTFFKTGTELYPGAAR